jgi:hypothetical protein
MIGVSAVALIITLAHRQLMSQARAPQGHQASQVSQVSQPTGRPGRDPSASPSRLPKEEL